MDKLYLKIISVLLLINVATLIFLAIQLLEMNSHLGDIVNELNFLKATLRS